MVKHCFLVLLNFPGGFAPSESAAPINGTNGAVPSGNKAGPTRQNGANGVAAIGANTIPLGSNGNVVPSTPVPRVGSSLPPPSCIGWAATIGKRHKDEYIGDLVCQAPRREEKIDVIASVVRRCIESFKKNRNKMPQRVVILRNGCTEGQFDMYEIPLVKKELEELGCTAKLTVIVPNRLQDVSFLRQDARPEDKSNEQNIPPGTVVDTVVVHPKRSEFFLNSHVAIKGTACTPHYTVLRDENDMSMDTLQTMVHYLCFGHQIVTKPTSLPSPVYIADEYNKGVEWPLRTYADMTKILSFLNTTYLRELRINA
ncbi:hypothetical protein niasHT_015492 [Heterodera trifolii]|uniref:Piwi domain-containing protein n=1 Tax=Heterodera trifolii TaxID=157864 RepID=A0ABD2L019_9BILA